MTEAKPTPKHTISLTYAELMTLHVILQKIGGDPTISLRSHADRINDEVIAAILNDAEPRQVMAYNANTICDDHGCPNAIYFAAGTKDLFG